MSCITQMWTVLGCTTLYLWTVFTSVLLQLNSPGLFVRFSLYFCPMWCWLCLNLNSLYPTLNVVHKCNGFITLCIRLVKGITFQNNVGRKWSKVLSEDKNRLCLKHTVIEPSATRWRCIVACLNRIWYCSWIIGHVKRIQESHLLI